MRLVLAAVVAVAACRAAPVPIAPSNAVTTPVVRTPVVTAPTIVAQLAYRGTFMIGPPYGRIPPFTVLSDGTLIDLPIADGPVMVTHISTSEVAAIVQHVRDLGFAKLHDHLGGCSTPHHGVMTCASDDEFTILRLASPTGTVEQVVTYSDFSNEPAIHAQIVEYLSTYRHAPGTAYVPTTAALHVQLSVPKTLPAKCRAFDPSGLHRPADADTWGERIDGELLAKLLAFAGANRADLWACHGRDLYHLVLVPGVPGTNVDEELAVYHRHDTE